MAENDVEVDPEFEKLVSAVETLENVALEHENKQTGPHKHECLENRAFIVAMAMRRLGLGVSEIGIVAEHLFDIECEQANAEDEDPQGEDILNATELNSE